eukprot:TRINITY_DN63758_c0_g1_i1.p1 TRINITY_DN63758_c0_g1~~TRINITY_DN63758_c0_g1_i1.p1  ORF type:complete len:194 (+),score=55.33 TRINITY_DN63758_c0_g1_i1:102-683(+)
MLALACIALGTCMCKADLISDESFISEGGLKPLSSSSGFGDAVTAGDLICLGGVVMVALQATLKTGQRPSKQQLASLSDLLREIGVQDPQVSEAQQEIEALLESIDQEPTLDGLVHSTTSSPELLPEKLSCSLVAKGWQEERISLLMEKLQKLSADVQQANADKAGFPEAAQQSTPGPRRPTTQFHTQCCAVQ